MQTDYNILHSTVHNKIDRPALEGIIDSCEEGLILCSFLFVKLHSLTTLSSNDPASNEASSDIDTAHKLYQYY